MIKTLRITSVLAAALAVVVFSLSVVYGMRSDPEIEKFLSSPGVMAKFNQAPDTRTRRPSNQISPLVKQAQALALRLNPPAIPKPVDTGRRTPPPVRTTPQVPQPSFSAKFKVIGTSVHTSDPNMSMALIDEPGKGMSWIRQASEVMHLKIVEIKDDVVVVSDGTRTFEKVAEPRPATVDLEGGPGGVPTVASTSGRSASTLPSSPVRTQRTALPPPTAVREAPSSQPVMSQQEDAALTALVERLKNLRREADSDNTDQAMDDAISSFRAQQVSPREAEQLDKLGKDLKQGGQAEPNVPRRPSSKISNSIPRRPSVTTRGGAPRP